MTPKGPWARAEIDRFLDVSILPVRVACNGRSGHPVLASLWFVPRDEALW